MKMPQAEMLRAFVYVKLRYYALFYEVHSAVDGVFVHWNEVVMTLGESLFQAFNYALNGEKIFDFE